MPNTAVKLLVRGPRRLARLALDSAQAAHDSTWTALHNAWSGCGLLGVPTISVVIPTIWRSQGIHELVRRLNAFDPVREIIVVDNANRQGGELVQFPKVRVINSPVNLYVNEAWNVGAREARSRVLAICNDDILFDPAILTWVSRAVTGPGVGIVGVSEPCIAAQFTDRARPGLTRVRVRPHCFGTLMVLKRSDYTVIPSDLKIWFGDDFLFLSLRKKHYAIRGVHMPTQMSTSAGSPEFRARKLQDWDVFHSKYKPVFEKKRA